MLTSPLAIVAVLCAAVAVSEWLARNTPLRHVGTALLVIVVTALLANGGVIPTVGADMPVYDALFDEVIGFGIFWLLLGVRLGEIARAGPAMLGMFAVGAVGIVVGVTAAMTTIGAVHFGEHAAGLGAMFVGTYTGGSVNFNTLADLYRIDETPALFAGAAVVDSLMTTVWMVVGVAVPRWLRPLPEPALDGDETVLEALEHGEHAEPDLGIDDDTESLHPLDTALAIGLAAGAYALSRALPTGALGVAVPLHPNILLTIIALVLAQIPLVARLAGTRTLGMFAIYLFLAGIGALCDVEALAEVGAIGGWLLLVVTVALAVHGALVFGVARLFGVSPEVASVASQACVGGGSSALALARSLGRKDLVLPSILVGSLGTASGTFVGMVVGSTLLGGATVG